MKRVLPIFCAIALAAFSATAQTDLQPDAGGVVILPSHGSIGPGEEITITFPNAMVPADRIDVADQPCPFVSSPKVEGTFLWKSQTEGVFTVSAVVPGAHHRLTLDPGLRDANGQPVASPNWGAVLDAAPFSVTTDFDERTHLSTQPQMELSANYDVQLSEVAAHVYFQDRDSRGRFPVNVILSSDDKVTSPPVAQTFRVEPRGLLPVDRSYDVIVDGLVDSRARQPLAYLKAFPAGKTVPLKVEWVGAFNSALDEPAIRIKFSDGIDPEEVTPARIRVEPAVPGMHLLASGDEVEIKGKFDLAQRYRVHISPEIRGEHGYGLTSEAAWQATFRPKTPTLLFPSSQVFLRARQELRFAFFQVNTPAVTWKIARIPLEKLGPVDARIREFERAATDPVTGDVVNDPRTGFAKPFPTELLIDSFALPVVNSGTCDAVTSDAKVQREIRCPAPAGGTWNGAYLLEATSRLPDGRIVGNRSIICASDFILTQKRSPTMVYLRVARMEDAQPVAGVNVRAVTIDNVELADAVTDADGLATFPRALLFPDKLPGAHLFNADTAAGPALQFVNALPYWTQNDERSLTNTDRVAIITDRNLYRPGQTVKMKGIMRKGTNIGPMVPYESAVHWTVTQSDGDRQMAEGNTALSAEGGWEAEWIVPDKIKLGRYQINAALGAEIYEGWTAVRVEEYRTPIFTVAVQAPNEIGETAHAHIASQYFHGAPNAGAQIHWKATWTATADSETEESDYRRRFNAYPELGPHLDPYGEELATVEGDGKLDARGFADLTCTSPFQTNAAIGKANVLWRAEVTSLEGQTMTTTGNETIFRAATRLGIKTEEKLQNPRGIHVEIDAVDSHDAKVKGVAATANLFRFTAKTVRQQIAPFVFRYQNTNQFEKIASQQTQTPASVDFSVKTPGRYVITATPADGRGPMVSDMTIVSGEGQVELPVENETSFKIDHPPGPFVPGQTVPLSIEAPFGGVAWVSIETDKILDTLLVPLSGNAGHIDLPIKKEYAPNATVAIYLVKPGDADTLPRERFAISNIEVRRPERELKVEPHLDRATVQPGEKVAGKLRVTSQGKPVAGADLAVFAVDDAVLQLGAWDLPELLGIFYPRNPFSITTYQALNRFQEAITKRDLTDKGFVIGGGGDDSQSGPIAARKEFRTLAFWQGSLKTDAQGEAAFSFPAPDNLTTYRLVAIGQTRASQFGGDASATVKISKPLLINPALPRFLRDGDEIELRAVVQQNFAENEEITARCVTDGNCPLLAADHATQNAARNAPVVFRFRAKVSDRALAPTKIRFEAVAKSNAKMADAVELTLPVSPPTVVRHESVAGSFRGPQFVARDAMPENWKKGRGQFTATVSTSPWLPKISGVPVLLDYPHGCFEQISSKLLGYALLAKLMAYLPEVDARRAEYRRMLERGLQQFSDSLVSNDLLPYWPGQEQGNVFVTTQALWATNVAASAGFEVPEGLNEKLTGALRKILNGQVPSTAFEKCFALFVLTQSGGDEFGNTSHELYLQRNDATDEGRAMLALALHRQKVMAAEQLQLLREIDAPPAVRAFDPRSFTSVDRAEAMRTMAFDEIVPAFWTGEKKRQAHARLMALLDSSEALSTQENLWLLLTFQAQLEREKAPGLTHATPAGQLSANKTGMAWSDRKMSDPLIVKGLNKSALHFLLRADYSTDEVQTDRVDNGFRVERIVKNLTNAARTGESAAPFKLGDQILITYRMNTRKKQSYVALEDALPSGLEVVNPNLAQVGKIFELPKEAENEQTLALSYCEMRDREALLYFDDVAPGSGGYSVLARATAAGTFRWPATQVSPMYDSRFNGLSPSSVCAVTGE